MLAEISETIETLPELVPLQKFLQKREKRLLKSSEQDVHDFKTGANSQRIEAVRASLAELAASQDLAALLLTALDEAYLTVSQRQGRIDPAQPATLHRVRIAFKKFRYLVEIIYPLLPGFSETQLKNMHTYQTALGEIQDVEVLLNTLADFAAGHKTYDPQPVHRFYEQRHTELINAYLENMNETITFWRATPEKPFPGNFQQRKPHESIPDASRHRRRSR
jgi:CHAD domain-containing protein